MLVLVVDTRCPGSLLVSQSVTADLETWQFRELLDVINYKMVLILFKLFLTTHSPFVPLASGLGLLYRYDAILQAPVDLVTDRLVIDLLQTCIFCHLHQSLELLHLCKMGI